MSFSIPGLSLFRPLGDEPSAGAGREVKRHRLLALLGAFLVLALGALYDATTPNAVTSAGVRLAVAGLFLTLFGLSYVSNAVRRHIAVWMQGVLYVLMGWFATLAAFNGFVGDYDMGILLLYALLPGVVAIGARRMTPVLWFLGVGFLMGTAGALLGPASLPEALAVLSSLAAVALVEGIAIQSHLATETQLRERDERLQDLTNSLPGVVFQAYFHPDGSHGSYFVSDHAESLLGLSSDPDGFHDRFVAHIPASHREEFRASIDEAVEAEASWRREIPFDTPSGERRWLLCVSTPRRRDGELVFNGVILDVTDRKKAERALREERNRFEMLFESLPTPVMRCTVEDGTPLIADVNGAFETVFGVESTRVEGQNANEILLPTADGNEAPANQDKAAKIDRRLLNNESITTEVRRAAADGPRDFQLQASGRTPTDASPEFYAIYIDITERKEREKKLRRKERRYQAIFQDPNILAGRLTPDGTLLDANQTAMEYVDASQNEVIGQRFWDTPWWSSEMESSVQDKVERAAGGEYVNFETDLSTPEGTPYSVAGTIRPVTDQTGEVVSLVFSARDVTERKRWEQELVEAKEETEEARELFEMILNNVPVMIDFFDAEGDLQMVNEHWEKVLGWSEEEIKASSDPTEVLYPDPSERQESRTFMEEAPDEWRDFRFQTKEGDVLDTTWTNVELSDGRRIGIGFDITPRKERERELRAAKEKAEEANEMKSAFLANMSHEIRTPLTSIIGFAEAIGDEVDADAEGAVPRFAGLIEESGRHLLDTLNAVLNLSKLEAGEMQLTPETVDLAAQAEDIAKQLRPQAAEADVSLHLDARTAPAQADEGGLQVVLRNLISNAIKYTNSDGDVWVRTWAANGTSILEVEDTGIGMDPEQVSLFFEPFRQASEGTSREYDGTGLGLAVTKRMIAQMDGAIDVETEQGKGSCFTVRLPQSGEPE